MRLEKKVILARPFIVDIEDTRYFIAHALAFFKDAFVTCSQ
jgi:hypothetical protein